MHANVNLKKEKVIQLTKFWSSSSIIYEHKANSDRKQSFVCNNVVLANSAGKLDTVAKFISSFICLYNVMMLIQEG